jgi:phosphoesterase RecJ-like protein
MILEKIWQKNIKLTNDSYPPKKFSFLPWFNLIDPNLDIKKFNPDLIISFDAASKDRLWAKFFENEEIFHKAKLVVIDHHISNSGFWDLNIINPLASSTCELVFDIFKYFKYNYLIDSDIATLLLSWIITDTNNFSNSNISKKTFDSWAELLELGAKHQDIIINLYKKNSFAKIKLWWKILKNIKKTKQEDIVWWVVPREYFLETWASIDDLDTFIDEFLVTINWVKIVFLLYDMWEEWIKWSFRSLSSKYNLAEFTKLFWGWWHPMAAWFLAKNKWIFDLESEVILALKNFISYIDNQKKL